MTALNEHYFFFFLKQNNLVFFEIINATHSSLMTTSGTQSSDNEMGSSSIPQKTEEFQARNSFFHFWGKKTGTFSNGVPVHSWTRSDIFLPCKQKFDSWRFETSRPVSTNKTVVNTNIQYVIKGQCLCVITAAPPFRITYKLIKTHHF